MILKLSLDLPEDVHFVPLIRQFGRGLLEFLMVVHADISDVETIITELASNVIRHAHSENGRFNIVLEFYADRVLISVIDTGDGFSFRDIPEVGTVRPDFGGGQRYGGFGLPMLDALSDHLDFRRTDPHGTTVCADKHLQYANQHDADKSEAMNQKGVMATVSAV